MNIKQEKARQIFIPLFICTAGIGILYSLFSYLFLFKFPIIEIDDLYSNIVIPGGIIILCFIFLLRPVINLMNFGDEGKFFITFITILFALIPIIIFQNYMESETGTLTIVKNPGEIHQLPLTKYYKITDYYIDKANYFRIINTSYYKTKLTLSSWFAIPLKNDTSATETNILYCSCYSNKKEAGILCNKAELVKWNNKVIPGHVLNMSDDVTYKRAVYFKRITKSEEYNNFMRAISEKWKNNNPVFLKPEYNNYEKRTSGMLEWSLSTFSFFNVFLSLLFWFSPYKVKDFSSKRAVKLAKRININQIKTFLVFCRPSQGIYFTLITIYLNIIVFIIMLSQGGDLFTLNTADMVKWGGSIKSLTLGGEYYRLIFSLFIHSGFQHLILDMIYLFIIGIFLESSSGTFTVAIIYLLSGIAGGLNSLYFHGSYFVSIGASGAIFGLFGFFLALIITKNTDRGVKELLIPLVVFISINLFIGLFGIIDLAGYIGGIVFGFVSGLFLSFYRWVNESY